MLTPIYAFTADAKIEGGGRWDLMLHEQGRVKLGGKRDFRQTAVELDSDYFTLRRHR